MSDRFSNWTFGHYVYEILSFKNGQKTIIIIIKKEDVVGNRH